MRWIGKNTTTHIIALLAIFAALTSFSLNGTDSLSTAISAQEGEDGPSELAFHFPDQSGEPALNTRIDDSEFSIFRFAHHRFFDLLGYTDPGNASCISRLQSHSTEIFFDNKNAILIKLRI